MWMGVLSGRGLFGRAVRVQEGVGEDRWRISHCVTESQTASCLASLILLSRLIVMTAIVFLMLCGYSKVESGTSSLIDVSVVKHLLIYTVLSRVVHGTSSDSSKPRDNHKT